MKSRVLVLLALSLVLGGCSTLGWQVGDMAKIKFDLNALDSNGLRGTEGGLRSVSYEFCFPGSIDNVDQVMAIDKTIVVYQQSPGRVQCGQNEYLGIGNTNQLDYREVLRKLAELDYISSIQEATFE
jgi:hypothetical protein